MCENVKLHTGQFILTKIDGFIAMVSLLCTHPFILNNCRAWLVYRATFA